jgi:hypothetical protein
MKCLAKSASVASNKPHPEQGTLSGVRSMLLRQSSPIKSHLVTIAPHLTTRHTNTNTNNSPLDVNENDNATKSRTCLTAYPTAATEP